MVYSRLHSQNREEAQNLLYLKASNTEKLDMLHIRELGERFREICNPEKEEQKTSVFVSDKIR